MIPRCFPKGLEAVLKYPDLLTISKAALEFRFRKSLSTCRSQLDRGVLRSFVKALRSLGYFLGGGCTRPSKADSGRKQRWHDMSWSFSCRRRALATCLRRFCWSCCGEKRIANRSSAVTAAATLSCFIYTAALIHPGILWILEEWSQLQDTNYFITEADGLATD